MAFTRGFIFKQIRFYRALFVVLKILPSPLLLQKKALSKPFWSKEVVFAGFFLFFGGSSGKKEHATNF